MNGANIHDCQCRCCRQPSDYADRDHHRLLNLFMSRLNPMQRRLFVAFESSRMGRGASQRLAEITGVGRATIARGRAELTALLNGTPIEPVGRPGRRSIEQKYPEIHNILERLVAEETGGDPMSCKKWVRVSSRKLSKKLAAMGIQVNYHKICRLLKQMGYSMKVNVKTRAATVNSPKRDRQFGYIAEQKAAFLAAGNPVISVDAKKKELIGDFKANGRLWCKEAIEVSNYTFASMAECVATPYGIYDIGLNKGYVWVGTSGDTPAFAVTAINLWWLQVGRHVYSDSTSLLILADGGGSNGCRCRAWKYRLQNLCNQHRLTITVCHYPNRCSKYNPIERRLFSHISMNWAGQPLSSLERMLGYIRGTTTKTGLSVQASLLEGVFPQGEKVTREEMARLALQPHETCPDWNYTIKPCETDKQ